MGAEESVAHDQRRVLTELGVSHVVSTMKHPPPWLVGKAGRVGGGDGLLPFEHLHVKVEDTKAADMRGHFEEISAFISRAREARGRVIVHCAFGQSRSVTAVAAHLVSCEGFTLGEALERIRSRRPKAHPNPSFLIQLVQHEIKLRGAPSDLRGFPSLPPQWQFIRWQDPLRAAVTLVSCHGRLLRVKRVSHHPRLYVVEGFLSREEAAQIRAVAAPELHPSLVVRHERGDGGGGGGDGSVGGDGVGGGGIGGVGGDDGGGDDGGGGDGLWTGERSEGRTSWNCRVPVKHPAVRGAVQRAAFLSGLAPSHSEAAQVVRYLPSQQYRPHFDWFDPREGQSYRRKTAAGGQRAVTCLVYLAEPERGGRTSFPKLGLVGKWVGGSLGGWGDIGRKR